MRISQVAGSLACLVLGVAAVHGGRGGDMNMGPNGAAGNGGGGGQGGNQKVGAVTGGNTGPAGSINNSQTGTTGAGAAGGNAAVTVGTILQGPQMNVGPVNAPTGVQITGGNAAGGSGGANNFGNNYNQGINMRGGDNNVKTGDNKSGDGGHGARGGDSGSKIQGSRTGRGGDAKLEATYAPTVAIPAGRRRRSLAPERLTRVYARAALQARAVLAPAMQKVLGDVVSAIVNGEDLPAELKTAYAASPLAATNPMPTNLKARKWAKIDWTVAIDMLKKDDLPPQALAAIKSKWTKAAPAQAPASAPAKNAPAPAAKQAKAGRPRRALRFARSVEVI